MKKVYESAIIVSGDASGGLKAIKVTKTELANLNKQMATTSKAGSAFGKKFDNSALSLHGFRSALLSITTVAIGQYFVNAADQMKNIDARLKIVTNSVGEFNFAQSELARISLETHSSIETTSRLYTRMQQSLTDASFSQVDLLKTTQAMNQAFAVSGATAHEASAAIIQMTQALASGQLRGEEYRSVAEQATRILQVLQKELGKTRGELLLMAHSGELTSELVINAMLNQSAVLSAEYAKLPLTVGRAISNADTNLKLFIKGVEDTVGITSILASTILTVSENLGSIGTFIAVGLFAKLGGAILKATIGLIEHVVYLGVAETATIGLSRATGVLNKRFALLGGVWGVALFAGIELISWMVDSQQKVVDFSDAYQTSMKEVETASADGFGTDDIPVFNESLKQATIEADRLREAIEKLKKEKVRGEELVDFAGFGDAKERMLMQFAAGSRVASTDAEIKATEDAFNKLRAEVEENISTVQRINKEFTLADATLIRHNLNVSESGLLYGSLNTAYGLAKNGLLSLVKQQTSANENIEKWTVSAQKQIDELNRSIDTFQMTKAEIVLYEASLIDSAGASSEFVKLQKKLENQLVKLTKKYENLRTEKSRLAAADKKEAARIKKEATAKKKRLDELNKSLAEATKNIDPLGALSDDLESKLGNLNETMADGSLNVVEYWEAWNILTSSFIKSASDLETEEEKFRAIIDAMDDEIDIMKAVGDEKLRLQAKRQLEIDGVTATTERVNELVDAYKREADASSIFGGGANTAQGFLGNIFSAGGFSQGLEVFQNGITSMFSTPENFSDGLNELSGVASQIGSIWQGTEGQDVLGRVAETTASTILALGSMIPVWGQIAAAIALAVDALTGGKLFGTAFEFESGFQNLDIGAQGGSGFVSQTQVRNRSFFRGREWETAISGISGDMQAAITQLFDNIIGVISSSVDYLNSDIIPELVAGSYRTDFDDQGNPTRQYSTVGGRQYDEGFDEFSSRLLAENILAVINAALPQVEQTFTETRNGFGFNEGRDDFDFEGVWDTIEVEVTRMVDQANFIAERWRGNAEMLLEGSQFLLLATKPILDGTSIFENLITATNFVEANAAANETLSDTYIRIIQSESLFQILLERMATTFDLAGDDLIQFSVDFVTMAGGIEAASGMVQTYFENFYTAQENALANSQALVDSAVSQLGDIGLDSEIDLSEFRELFEAQLNDLAPEDLVQWLEAAEALAALNQEMLRLVQAEQNYLDFIQAFNAQLLSVSGTEYGTAIYALGLELEEQIDIANQLAIAAGRAGASTEDLAAIQAVYANQTDAIVEQLRKRVVDLINQLYGDDLDAQIADLESQQVTSINNVGNSAIQMYENQLRAVESISQVIDSLLINEQLSPLSRTDQFNEAFSQFNEMLALAQGGDVDAMNQLPAMAQTLLGIARDVFASGDDYTNIFDSVISGLQSIGVTLSEPPVPQTQPVVLIPSAQLEELYAEREARDALLYAQQRLELAQQLAIYLSDLAGFVNQPVLELANSLGVSMADLVTDLGVNLEEMTVETTSQLANISNVLGVEILALAATLGEGIAEQLGVLADSQSLLNDALEASIAQLPETSATFLAPFLEAIENATNEADANQAIADMEAAIAELPVDQANQLAPFFDNIDFISEFTQQINLMDAQRNAIIDGNVILNRIVTREDSGNIITRDIRTENQIQTGILGSINTGIRDVITAISDIPTATSGSPTFPQFASGVKKLQSNKVIQAHQGETILPAWLVKGLEDYSLPFGGQSSGGDGMTSKMANAVIESNNQITNALSTYTDAITRAGKENADRIADALISNERTNCR